MCLYCYTKQAIEEKVEWSVVWETNVRGQRGVIVM